MQIKIKNILLFYDFPQVFIGVDCVDTSYVCMIVEDESDPVYFCTPVSKRKEVLLCSNGLDLRDIFSNPESNCFYYTKILDAENFSLVETEHKSCPHDYLPEAGLYFDNDYEILSDGSELKSTISHVSLQVPNSSSFPKIEAELLSRFIHLYQSSVKYLSKLGAKNTKSKHSRDESMFETDVYNFSHGSFKLKLMGRSDDVLGDNPYIISAFEKVNEFLSMSDDIKKLDSFMNQVPGHATTSLINLIDFLSENSIPITHKWFSPSTGNVETVIASLSQVAEISQKLKLTEIMSTEELKLVGDFYAADSHTMTWKFFDDVSDENFSGSVDENSGITLNGIIISKQRYEITCDEVLEINKSTKKEKKKLFLKAINKI